MNCNTTHYRANSSSVPGDPTGLKATHDEEQIYREEMELAEAQARVAAGKMDWFGFVASFKSVALEGLEVAFIVIALGVASAQPHALVSAAAGAGIAGALVIGAALIVAKPLARVPENHLKFVVGLMLTSFGTFWTAEGLGANWWHADASVLWLIGGYLAVSVLLIGGIRRIAERSRRAVAPSPASAVGS